MFIKANDRSIEQAVSVKMYDAFLRKYREMNPNDQITELDLFKMNLPYYGNTALNGLFKKSKGMELTAEETSMVKPVEEQLELFKQAEKLVFAFPLWNFTVPGPLVTYVSYLCQAGITFKYTENGPVGLATGKKVALLFASGGVYSSGPMESKDMSLNYMKTIIRFLGMTDVESVTIEGHGAYPDRAETIIKEGLEKTSQLATKF